MSSIVFLSACLNDWLWLCVYEDDDEQLCISLANIGGCKRLNWKPGLEYLINQVENVSSDFGHASLPERSEDEIFVSSTQQVGIRFWLNLATPCFRSEDGIFVGHLNK